LAFSLHSEERMTDEITAEPPRSAPRGPGEQAPETAERIAAMQRAQELARLRREGHTPPRDPYYGMASPEVARRAFATLSDNVRDYAIFLMDPRGVITFWGRGAHLMKWWTRDEAEGAHLRFLYPDGGSDDGTAEEHLVQAAEQGEYTGEGLRIRSGGSTFWAGITLTALRDEQGKLLGFAKVTRDLTARRAADALLHAASAAAETARIEAEAANRAKSGFLATMSHEIRTPINAILGYHELLELEIEGPLNEGQRHYLDRAIESGRHLLTLINEVLDFSRIESGRVGVQQRVFRVSEAVAAALALVAPQARAKGLRLLDATSGYASGLAAAGDEDRVRQVLVNLLSNAVKFTGGDEAQGRRGLITVSVGAAATPPPDAELSGEGPWVYVRVEDTGTGIPSNRLDAVFEPFVQADMTHTREHGGTGLGLAISRRLARLMQGDITTRSEVGVGSVFFLWLPAAPAESMVPGTGATDGRPAEAGGTGATLAETSQPGLVRHVGEAVLGEMERILHAYVSRLRSDPATPSARRVSEAELEDHLATFLADLSSTLWTLDVASGTADPSAVDGGAIRTTIAERHGAQRARMGWAVPEVEREFDILGEEITAAVRRRLSRWPDGLLPREEEQVATIIEPFVETARRTSLARLQQG
jgi:PAS domain S-box-containing protein